MDQSDVLLDNQTITIKTLIILALYVRLTFFVNMSCRVFNYILLPWGFLYETKRSFLNNSEKFNASFSFNKSRRHLTAVLKSLNSFNKRGFITENVKRKPQFEIMSSLEFIFFFLSNRHYIQQCLQQCFDCLLNFIGGTRKTTIILAR